MAQSLYTAYLASCHRYGIAPSAHDYDDYKRELMIDEPDSDDTSIDEHPALTPGYGLA